MFPVSQCESNSVKRLGTNLGYVYHREIIQFMPCRWLDSLVVSSSLTRHNFVPASRLLKWLVIPCRTAQTRRRCCLLCVHCPWFQGLAASICPSFCNLWWMMTRPWPMSLTAALSVISWQWRTARCPWWVLFCWSACHREQEEQITSFGWPALEPLDKFGVSFQSVGQMVMVGPKDLKFLWVTECQQVWLLVA